MISRLTVLLIFSSTVLWSQLSKMDLPLSDTIYKITDKDTLKVHWYAPVKNTDKPTPAVAFFFGGGWRGGSYEHFKRQALYFAQRGLTTFLFDYRVESRQGTSPVACIEDARSAIRFIKKNHLKFNIDPLKIVSSGGSAGGHIAAATGTLSTINATSDDLAIDPTPAAMVLFNPVFDNGPGGYHGAAAKEWIEKDFLCHCQNSKVRNGKWARLFKFRYHELSPLHNITDQTPPTLVMLGKKDHLIPVATALKFQDTMRGLGNTCEVLLYDGGTHGFFNGNRTGSSSENRVLAEYFFQTLQAAEDFLVKLNLLETSEEVRDYFD